MARIELDTPNIVLTVLLLISGTLGIVLNGSFLLINLYKRNFKPEYCWFVLCLASFNFLYNLDAAILEPYSILARIDDTGTLCLISGYVLVSCAMGSIMCQPLLSINRCFNLFNKEANVKYFSKKRCLIAIPSLYFAVFLFTAICIPTGDFGRFDGLCCLALRKMPLWRFFLIFGLPVFLAYGTSIYCAYKISRLIKNQMAAGETTMVRSRIVEGKSIITFIIVEVGLPILLEAPVLISIFLNQMAIQVPHYLLSPCAGLFVIHATTDPVMVTLVIRPYRKAFMDWFGKTAGHLRRTTRVVPTTEVAAADKGKQLKG